MITLDEIDLVEQALDRHKLADKKFETLHRVARYYLDVGYSRQEVRRLLEDFLKQCDSKIAIPKWSKQINLAIRYASKHPLVHIDYIGVSETELQKIKSLKKRKLERLAFTLLCIAKFNDITRQNNNHWVRTKDTEIMKMANISAQIKEQCLLFHDLYNLGFIKRSKRVDSLSVQVTFIDNEPPALYIRDFRNLGFQYLQYLGEPFFQCVNCGLTVKIRNASNGRPPKYCPACAAEIHTKQKVESVMRLRNKNVDKNHTSLSQST